MKLLDEDIGGAGHLYEVTWVGHLAGRVVRLQVKRNPYSNQSQATASILSAVGDWTVLVTRHPDRWWEGTGPLRLDTDAEARAQLEPVLDKLEASALMVLSVPA